MTAAGLKHVRSVREHLIVICAASAILLFTPAAPGDDIVVTTLADFEDNTTAISIEETMNAAAADCRAGSAPIPARGQRSLKIEVGSTKPQASAAFDLRFRQTMQFSQANSVAMYAWISEGAAELRFRVRDANGRIFQTKASPLRASNRWVRLESGLSSRDLELAGSKESGERVAAEWPLIIQGVCVQTSRIGRQVVFIDDLEVEHRVDGAAMLNGEFVLNEPTHIYEPGAVVRASLMLENKSRRIALPVSVDIACLKRGDVEIEGTSAAINLPASGADFRSRQLIEFSRRIDEPGLYRLRARVRGARWLTPAEFQTTIAVVYSNRAASRGRSTFYGLSAKLLTESPVDQKLEIDVAREIGAQLLAIETPWRQIEQSQGRYALEVLDGLIERITQKDIAAMVVVTDPPEWASADPDVLWARQAALCEELVRRFGDRITLIQPLSAERGVLSEHDATRLAELEAKLTSIKSHISVCAPPIEIPLESPGSATLPQIPEGARFELSFETSGPTGEALQALETFAAARGVKWGARHRWIHRSCPNVGSRDRHDADALLDYYLSAAGAGVAGAIWRDLRDSVFEPPEHSATRGMLRRDFSPKYTLVGFANTVGVLHGLIYAGQAPGASEDFDSALLIGGARQVMVVRAKPNRTLPLALTPYQIVNGTMAVTGFDRRYLPMEYYDGAAFVQSLSEPMFIEFDAERSSDDAMIGFSESWLQAPRSVYCGKSTRFKIAIEAPIDLRRSYLQLSTPPNCPLESSISSRALRADRGEKLEFEVVLNRVREFTSPTPLTLKLRIEGATLTFTIDAHPLTEIHRIPSLSNLTDEGHVVGRMTKRDSSAKMNDRSSDDSQSPKFYAGWQERKLYMNFVLPDAVPANAALTVGLATEGADERADARVNDLGAEPDLSGVEGLSSSPPRGWRCKALEEDGRRFIQLLISPRSLGLSSFEAGQRILCYARYESSLDNDDASALILKWGGGSSEGCDATSYNWTILADTD